LIYSYGYTLQIPVVYHPFTDNKNEKETTMRFMTGLLISILSILIFASNADAQILKKLKNKAKNATEDKLEQKIDQEIEKTAERMVENSWEIFFGGEEYYDEEGNPQMSPFSLSSNANVEDTYHFEVVTTMEIENIKKNGKKESPMYMDMHFNNDQMYTGTKISGEQMEEADGDIFIIYDLKNEAMVMLMDSKDGKFSFAYDWKQAEEFANKFSEMYDAEEEAEEPEMPQFQKIGTKTISGKSCEGYLTESEKSKMEIWVTQDEDLGIQKMFQVNSQAKHLKGKVPEDYPNGMMMEIIHEDLDNGEETVMKVTDINKNANIAYNMSDYPAMSFGNKE